MKSQDYSQILENNHAFIGLKYVIFSHNELTYGVKHTRKALHMLFCGFDLPFIIKFQHTHTGLFVPFHKLNANVKNMKCTGLKAVSYPDTQYLIKGSTVKTRTNTRIFYI